jgi:hypothetical protein
VLGSSAPLFTDPARRRALSEEFARCPGGAEAVVLVEGGVVWVVLVAPDCSGPAAVVVPSTPPGDEAVVVGIFEVVVPWGVDVDGAVVVELNVGLVVLVVVDSVLVDAVVSFVEVLVNVDDEPPVVVAQWSSFPEALPWSSHSRPFVFGSVLHG